MITRTITKRNGDRFTVLLDDADADIYDAHSWCMVNGYVGRSRGKGKGTMYLHRVLLGSPRGKDIDHINGNRQDNRRCNLRACSEAQNVQNRSRQYNNTSGYMGVYLFKEDTWRAQLTANGRHIHVGLFDTALEAAIARDRAASEYHKEFARLNFPELALAS